MRNNLYSAILFTLAMAMFGLANPAYPQQLAKPQALNPQNPIEKAHTVRFKQDDAQPFIVSKIYDLKHILASDLVPYIKAAVQRYDNNSLVQSANCREAGKEYLVVSTPIENIPYIDDMISKMDRPGLKDRFGSTISGTGITRCVYYPKNRATQEIAKIMEALPASSDGQVFLDSGTNMFYFKDSTSTSEVIMDYLKLFDRPVPQAELVMTVYELRESDLKQIGIDYVGWKNGPGLDLFGAGFNAMSLQGADEIFNNVLTPGLEIASRSSFGWGGFLFAPQFDMSFVRLLAQTGYAKLEESGTLKVVNDYSGSYSLHFSPAFQNIQKKERTDQTMVVEGNLPVFDLTISNPTICVYRPCSGDYSGIFYPEEKSDGSILFKYHLKTKNNLENNNFGDQLTEENIITSDITLGFGREKLLGTYERETDVTQYIGMPWLSDIPVLKYLFGTETTLKAKTIFIVTVRARMVNTDEQIAGWAGKLVKLQDEMEKPSQESSGKQDKMVIPPLLNSTPAQ